MRLLEWMLAGCLLLAAPAFASPPYTVPEQPGPLTLFVDVDTLVDQLKVGPQSGILAVEGENFNRGADDTSRARLSRKELIDLFVALNLYPDDLPAVAHQLMVSSGSNPRPESVALLGAIGRSFTTEPELRKEIEHYLVGAMDFAEDTVARRQAILALATLPEIQPATAERVVSYFEFTKNLWEAFPVQQFVEYHAETLRHMDNFPELQARLAQVDSLYTPFVLQALNSGATLVQDEDE